MAYLITAALAIVVLTVVVLYYAHRMGMTTLRVHGSSRWIGKVEIEMSRPSPQPTDSDREIRVGAELKADGVPPARSARSMRSARRKRLRP